MSKVTITIIFVFFVIYLFWQAMKNFQLKSLNNSIAKNDIETTIKLTDMATSRRFLGEYTCDMYKLKAYYISNDMHEFDKMICYITQKQYKGNPDKKSLIEQYYHRFLINGNREQAEILLDNIKKMGDDSFTLYNEQSFSVMLDNKTDLIKPIIDEINSKKYYGFPLGVMLFMLARQYELMGDKQNADTYYENAKVCFHPKAIYMPLVLKHINKS